MDQPDKKPYESLEVGDWVWLHSEPGRFTVEWCNPDYDGIQLIEDNNPSRRYHTDRDDIRKARRPAGKPYAPPTPPPGPPF